MYGNNLRINKVTRKDNGVYDCEVSAGEGQFGEVRVQLTVMGKDPFLVTFKHFYSTSTHIFTIKRSLFFAYEWTTVLQYSM